MTQPAVIITEQDGALGVLPPSGGRLLAVLGPASSGDIAVPATYGRVKDLVAAFGGGPAVEAAAYYVDTYGKPVLFVRCGASAPGTVSAIDANELDGTAVVTVGADPTPSDDLEYVFKVIAGGTVGSAGITYKLSADGGRSYGPTLQLGTAVSVEVDPGGVDFEIAVGTLATGATYAARANAPQPNGTDLNTALDALAASAVQWEICQMAFAMEAGLFGNVETKFSGMFNVGKFRSWIGNTRMPTDVETEANYLLTLSTLFANATTVRGCLYAGACKLTSAISGRQYKRPVAIAAAAREQSVSEEINIADVNLGSLPGVQIRDANGNADEHDESLNPGLDDARFAVLRTWDGLAGVYVNRPRIFSAEGSDFQLMPHRRVMDLTHAALRNYFVRRLNKPIRVNATTGYILESEALEIEAGALASMRSVLLAKPKASAVQFVLSRVDNLLSTKTLTGTARVVPMAYPEFITLDVGFVNPALVVQAA